MTRRKTPKPISYTPPAPELNVWKDETRRDEIDGSNLRTDELRVVIHHHMHTPDAWFVTCYELGVYDRQLDATELDKAKKEGLNIVRRKARKLYFELRKAMGMKEDHDL